MCNPIHLSGNNENYISHCKTCNKFQICFGTTAINLEKEDFVAMHQLAKSLLEEQTDYPDDTRKQVIIQTPYQGVNLFLSISELRSYIEMFEEADNEIIALEMLDLFGEDKD